jgi:hypothetical protein
VKKKNLGSPSFASIEDRRDTTVADAMKSASAALSKMGNQPLPSKRAPKGNNPGSLASMKFPRTSRSK